ncbi:DNA cytosine methyltransferase [Chelatococcus reniformis]|uniref:DNA (cytosine-5-)-methyltransferase n=1 Tax=Chelatococcus reniformis TaxID=1494448 RepID=A0A916UWW1_9HYPH|nr:DNA cytosine methyltransferase [Chelatococcus reniformis]GGC90727.1 hypothetical protein GCM10010994_55660 [Chelatococcus reniformis]
MNAPTIDVDIPVAHFFCGVGAGAKGFNRGHARVGQLRAKFRCIGGIDVDPGAIRNFDRIAGVRGTVLDLFSRQQYVAFHAKEPPPGWREATIVDIHRAFNNERPRIVFLSAPCKGFSGLLSESTSLTDKYQALNALTLRGVWLMLEAYKDDPPDLIVFENVPRILVRGRRLLDQIAALFRSYGYEWAETTHDCGEIGGLAQSRKRMLGVARHREKVPNFLYEPLKLPLRAVGDVLGKLPLPGDIERGGPMHRMPALQWKTWVRLAFVEAGADWRSLNKLRVENGMLADFGLMPPGPLRNGAFGVVDWANSAGTVQGESLPSNGRFAVADPRPEEAGWQSSVLGVQQWDGTSGVIAGRSSPTNGAFSVADPRIDGHERSVQLGVRRWDQTAAVVKGDVSVGTGPYAVSDPRPQRKVFNNIFRIVPWGAPSPAVAGPGGAAGGVAVADPRAAAGFGGKGKYKVSRFGEPAGTVIGASTTGQGAFALADPRPGYGPSTHHNIIQVHGWGETSKTVTSGTHPSGGALSVADPRPTGLNRGGREGYASQGHYGVQAWDGTSGAVPAYAKYDRGAWAIADPRPTPPSEIEALPEPDTHLVAMIQALDGTWHRPFTTLELAALQSLVDPDEIFTLEGKSDSQAREWIGNAVPPAAAEAIAGVMGRTILLAMSGETFMLSSEPIWVRDVAVALSVDTGVAL